jgi:hypothetical protein
VLAESSSQRKEDCWWLRRGINPQQHFEGAVGVGESGASASVREMQVKEGGGAPETSHKLSDPQVCRGLTSSAKPGRFDIFQPRAPLPLSVPSSFTKHNLRAINLLSDCRESAKNFL